MINYEKMRTQQDETLDEMAVKMLLSQIDEDVDKNFFKTFKLYDSYFGLYKSMKDWLNSEVEE